ncbi:hypothetical protein EV421DRAFT_1745421 [Armillaria borealis]|uniref:Uncharacterized protein n=1 Tax=Armillaria borealis TaxID=47425 RepID=A0AA39MD87_9AGAR|nr:hypothetical protein EV421DRAFT_1745421 [Armillaria borealis]
MPPGFWNEQSSPSQLQVMRTSLFQADILEYAMAPIIWNGVADACTQSSLEWSEVPFFNVDTPWYPLSIVFLLPAQPMCCGCKVKYGPMRSSSPTICWACPKAATVAMQHEHNDCVLHDDLNCHLKQYADTIISSELKEFWQSYMGVWTGKYPEMVLNIHTSGVALWSASIHTLREYLEVQFNTHGGIWLSSFPALTSMIQVPTYSIHLLDNSHVYDSGVSESEPAVDGQDLNKQDYAPPLPECSGYHSCGESEDRRHDTPQEDVCERVLLWRDAVIALADKINIFLATDLASDPSSSG